MGMYRAPRARHDGVARRGIARALRGRGAARRRFGELGEILGLSSDAAPAHVDEDWAAFLDKWRYGPEQRAAIRRTLYDNWAPIVRREVFSPVAAPEDE